MTPNEFIENGKPFLLEDGYTKCRSFFYFHKEQLGREDVISEATQVLLSYLEQEGHLRTIGNFERERIVTNIIAFVSKHPAPFAWRVEDNDYVDKVYDLYCQIQNICNLDQKSQLLIITRIISVIYGCCPTFSPQLLAILGLPLRTNNVLLCLASYHQLSILPIFLAAFLALINPKTDSNKRVWATETIHAIFEDVAEHRKFKTNTYQPQI